MQPCADVEHPASSTTDAIGRLCIGGDWACVHGDVVVLADIARRLADYAPEPLHCDLTALAELCTSEPQRAPAVWMELREQLFQTDACWPS
jgi:hypothetical protein